MIILVFVAIMSLALQTLSLRKIAVTNLRENLFTTGIFTGMIAVCFGIWTFATKGQISLPTLIWGSVLGVTFVSTIIVYYYAMKTGPLSYTTFMFSASMVIPALAGIIFWKESVKITTVLGLILFLISFYFISVSGKSSENKVNKKWLVFCFLSWLMNGCCSVISKIQQTVMNGTECISMITVSFSFAFAVCVVSYVFMVITTPKNGFIKKDITLVKQSIVPIMLVALGSGTANSVILYLSSRMPSAYLFPIVLGGLIIAVAIYSRVILKEVLSKFGIIGIMVGLTAIIMLNL